MAQAKNGHGGARPGAGAPPGRPIIADVVPPEAGDARGFLAALIDDPSVDLRLRVDAAKAILSNDARRQVDAGKKAARAAAAKEAAVGRFAPKPPPKLVAVGK